MPTIPQLPPTPEVTSGDEIPLSQAGVTRTARVGTLLASTQPAILSPTGTLLGRTSMGPGGPEPVAIGAGLTLGNIGLSANGTDHAAFAQQNTLLPTDEVVLNSAGTPKRMVVSMLRGLFSAGSNITIDPVGTIACSPLSSSITGLNQVSTISANDLVGISQSGTDHTITYANLINGQTIDLAQSAVAASDPDSFWVAQGSSTMFRQTFSALWNWITTKIPTYKRPVVELSANTTLDGTVHNGRILICSAPLTLTPAFISMGSGFHCDVINLSSGSITLGSGIMSSTGSNSLPAGQYANLRAATYSAGNVIFAAIPGGTTSLLVPGQVTGLNATSATSNSITISWSPPTTGGTPTSYMIQYRVIGTTTWLTAGSSPTGTTAVLAILSPSTTYNVQVMAVNASGSGSPSTILSTSTTSAGLVTAITWNLPPIGPYAHGAGSIGVNVHVNPSTATVQFGFSTSATVPPTSWTVGNIVAADIWAAYVTTPATAGSWYAWAEGTDGSTATVYPTAFVVT